MNEIKTGSAELGWECPKCQRCFAPFVQECYRCGPRRSYEILGPLATWADAAEAKPEEES